MNQDVVAPEEAITVLLEPVARKTTSNLQDLFEKSDKSALINESQSLSQIDQIKGQ